MNSILKYIPQRPPFVFVDTLIDSNEQFTISLFKITQDQTLVENNQLTEGGLIENIAQTAAAGVGFYCEKNNVSVPIGFIGAVKNLKILRLPKTNEVLTTKVEVLQEVFGITLIKGTVFIASTEIASAELKIIIENKR
jgi:predicted hotdog family 3-hydroxylacyl-ACP dehydratase